MYIFTTKEIEKVLIYTFWKKKSLQGEIVISAEFVFIYLYSHTLIFEKAFIKLLAIYTKNL